MTIQETNLYFQKKYKDLYGNYGKLNFYQLKHIEIYSTAFVLKVENEYAKITMDPISLDPSSIDESLLDSIFNKFNEKILPYMKPYLRQEKLNELGI